MLLLQMLRSTKPGSVPMPRVCLSVTLRPTLCPFLGYPCSLLSKPVARVPVLVSLHRAFWEPQFLESSRSLALLWLLRFKLGPLPRSSLGAAPAPPGGQDRCDPGGALRGSAHPAPPAPSAPPVIAAGPEWGAGGGGGAGSRDSEPGSAGSSPRSGRRERGSRAARPSAARTCGPGRAGAERAPQSCWLHTDCVGEWERGPNPSPRKCARGPPRPDPAPGRPCPRGADPAPAPHPAGGGPDPAHTSSVGWSPLQAPSAGPV